MQVTARVPAVFLYKAIKVRCSLASHMLLAAIEHAVIVEAC